MRVTEFTMSAFTWNPVATNPVLTTGDGLSTSAYWIREVIHQADPLMAHIGGNCIVASDAADK